MRLLVVLILFFAAVSATAADARPFAGTWEGRLDGKVFARAVIKPGDPVAGTVSFGNIRANTDGDLIDVESEPEETYPMLHPEIRDERILAFSWDDGDGVERLELRLTAAPTAELHFLGGPVVIKPLTLKRTKE